MTYLFVVPRDNSFEFLTIPPGVVYVATSLKASGRMVFGLHLNYEQDPEAALAKVIIDKKVDVVCVGGLSDQYCEVKKVVKLSKKINNRIVTVIGGGLVTAQPELIMNHIGADFAIVGQGEITICDLADALEGNKEFNRIPGLLFFENDTLVVNQPRPEEENLDRLPFPDYGIFDYPQVPNRRISINGRMKKSVNITASRSCPYRCTFCYHPSGSFYRQRSLDNIFAEIDHLIAGYEIEHLNIIDELFARDKDRVVEFCRRIKPYGLTFGVQLRVDNVTEDLLRELHDAGCIVIGYGLESADDTVLKSMKKGIAVEQIDNALSLTRKAGIFIQGYFIFGDVAETAKTVDTTIKWWLAHLDYGINLAMIRVFPGSELYRYAVGHRVIEDEIGYLEGGCPLVNLSTLSNHEFSVLLRKISYLNAEFLGLTLNIEVKKINTDSSYCLSAECIHCGFVNVYDHVQFEYKNVNGAESFCCMRCAQKMKMQPSNAISRQTYKHILDKSLEKYFSALLAGGKKVAIWGVTEKATALLLSSKTLRDSVVMVVDRDFQIKTDKLLDLYPVVAPERLRDVVFDYLLIGAFGYEAQIRNSLQAMGVSAAVLDL